MDNANKAHALVVVDAGGGGCEDRLCRAVHFLEFIADRLVMHGDDPNADFVLALRRKAAKARAAIKAATGGET